MKFIKLATFAALIGIHALSSAQTYTAVAGSGFTTETTSSSLFLTPAVASGSVTSYSVLSTAAGFSSIGTITFAAPVKLFTFLWGSPDSFNSVTDGLVTVTGSMVSSGTGNNAESLLYTFADAAGFSSLTFKTTGIAFELAAAPVPEPQTYAMIFGGLGIVLLLSRRRRS